MPAPPYNSGWASWLSQFLPQIGAPQPGNILNSPAPGPSLGRIGLPQFMGGQGLYQPPQQQPGPPMQLGPNAMPPGPMDPSIMAQMARQDTPGGGASGSWGPAATSTAAPGSGALGGATGSWGAPMSGAPPGTSPSGPGAINQPGKPTGPMGPGPINQLGQPTGPTTAPGRPSVPPGLAIGSPAPAVPPPRPAGLGAPVPGPMAQGSPFVQIARPNAPPLAGSAQGRGGPPMMSALDLSRLFGRRVV